MQDDARASNAQTRPSPFQPPLYQQRAQLIYKILRAHRCRRFIDAGCAQGTLLAFLLASQLQQRCFTYAMGIDRAAEALHAAYEALPHAANCPTAPLHETVVDLVQGDLTCLPSTWPPEHVQGPHIDGTSMRTSSEENLVQGSNGAYNMSCEVDAVLCVEVLEHIAPHDVAAFTDVLFAHLAGSSGGGRARLLILTTPNRAANGRFDDIREDTAEATASTSTHNNEKSADTACQTECNGDDDGREAVLCELPAERSIYSTRLRQPRRRHPEHYFELTPAQLVAYCDYVIAYFAPYWSHYELIGVGDSFTQGAVFYKAAATLPSHRDDVNRERCSDADDVPWRYSRRERRAHFPFAAIFGMSWADYCREFDIRDAHEGVQETVGVNECNNINTSRYVCVMQDRLEAQSLWQRVCDVVREEVRSAAQGIAAIMPTGQRHTPYIASEQRIAAQSTRDRAAAAAAEMRAANTRAFAEQHRLHTASSSSSLLHSSHMCKGPQCIGCMSFAQLLPLPAVHNLREHWRAVYGCTVAALTHLLREQRAAWSAAYVDALRAWCGYVKRAPAKLALHPCDVFRDEHYNKDTTNMKMDEERRTSWRRQSVAQLSLHLQTRYSTCVVRHDNRAAAAILDTQDTEEGCRRALDLVHALQLAQSGLRVYDWLLSYWHGTLVHNKQQQQQQQQQKERSGSSAEGACACEDDDDEDDDETRCSDVFAPVVWRLLFFMAAVDELPGAGRWLRQRLPRLWPRHMDLATPSVHQVNAGQSVARSVYCTRRRQTMTSSSNSKDDEEDDRLARVADALCLWPCCPRRLMA